MRVISVPTEGDHKGPHPASTSTPAHTMTTDGLMRCFVIIVWAGAVERGVGSLAVALEWRLEKEQLCRNQLLFVII
jgi:hypothetical protein